MFDRWREFYLMAGSAAAVLIGLIFVVVTLMHGRSRSSVLAGSKLYMGPIVLQMSFLLVISSAALVPGLSRERFALLAGVVAAWGLARGIKSAVGIRGRASGIEEPHWTDIYYYGLVPSLIYAALGAVAVGVWRGAAWGEQGMAAVAVALILLSVRNEWDLVTWLTPVADE